MNPRRQKQYASDRVSEERGVRSEERGAGSDESRVTCGQQSLRLTSSSDGVVIDEVSTALADGGISPHEESVHLQRLEASYLGSDPRNGGVSGCIEESVVRVLQRTKVKAVH